MLARFSTVAGEQGSPDTWRDPRGFALKFYTTEGNYDLGRQQHPGLLRPRHDEVPALHPLQKRRGGSGLRDNNMQWDFWTLNPESAHQVTYLMGDRGIPRTWPHMNGYGSHTFLWVNAAGEKHWVKYHFHSDQGVEGLTDADATRIAGEDADFHRRDLRTAIDTGDFPSWTLSIQAMPYEDAKTYRSTRSTSPRIWPHSDYPLIKVGTMTLNRNPENFFARSSRRRSSRVRSCRASASARTRCCSAGCSPTPTPTATGSARTTSSCRSTSTGWRRQHLHPGRRDGLRAPRRRPGLRAQLLRSRLRRRGRRGHRGLGGRWRDGAPGLHAARRDDDFGQAGTLVREVWNDEIREAFVNTVAGHLLGGVEGDVLERAFRYWTSVDADTGKKIEELVRTRREGDAPGAQPDAAKSDAGTPIVEDATRAGT
jgi:catalase